MVDSGIDFGKIFSNLAKAVEDKDVADETITKTQDKYASAKVVADAQQQDSNTRKFCICTATQIMIDGNNSEGMNYNWKDIITLAEKVRAYVEGGICIDSSTAWQGIPKEVDMQQTLGDN